MRAWLFAPLWAALLRKERAAPTELVENEETEGWDHEWGTEEAAGALAAELRRYESELHLDDVGWLGERVQLNTTGGVHTCGCVSPGNEKRRALKKLRWLHFPKTGTSFWSTIYQYACRKKGTMDLDISPFWKEQCGSCYDFAVKERFPPDEFCDADAFSTLETQHRPLQPAHGDVPENTVTFFREPQERLLSAAVNSHMSGFSPENFKAARAKCYTPVLDPHCFVQYPGIRGCQARMLTGGMCADDNAAKGAPFPVNVQSALAVVQRLGFIGLTEEWNDSVCLFHKMFGGDVRQEEFKNFHLSNHVKPDVDVSDPVDGPVYQAAKARFHALLKEHGAEQCYQFQPAACVPKSCEDVGFQCGGPMDDGCGGKLQCGGCPQFRAGPAQCADHSCSATQRGAPDDTFDVSSFRRGHH